MSSSSSSTSSSLSLSSYIIASSPRHRFGDNQQQQQQQKQAQIRFSKSNMATNFTTNTMSPFTAASYHHRFGSLSTPPPPPPPLPAPLAPVAPILFSTLPAQSQQQRSTAAAATSTGPAPVSGAGLSTGFSNSAGARLVAKRLRKLRQCSARLRSDGIGHGNPLLETIQTLTVCSDSEDDDDDDDDDDGDGGEEEEEDEVEEDNTAFQIPNRRDSDPVRDQDQNRIPVSTADREYVGNFRNSAQQQQQQQSTMRNLYQNMTAHFLASSEEEEEEEEEEKEEEEEEEAKHEKEEKKKDEKEEDEQQQQQPLELIETNNNNNNDYYYPHHMRDCGRPLRNRSNHESSHDDDDDDAPLYGRKQSRLSGLALVTAVRNVDCHGEDDADDDKDNGNDNGGDDKGKFTKKYYHQSKIGAGEPIINNNRAKSVRFNAAVQVIAVSPRSSPPQQSQQQSQQQPQQQSKFGFQFLAHKFYELGGGGGGGEKTAFINRNAAEEEDLAGKNQADDNSNRTSEYMDKLFDFENVPIGYSYRNACRSSSSSPPPPSAPTDPVHHGQHRACANPDFDFYLAAGRKSKKQARPIANNRKPSSSSSPLPLSVIQESLSNSASETTTTTATTAAAAKIGKISKNSEKQRQKSILKDPLCAALRTEIRRGALSIRSAAKLENEIDALLHGAAMASVSKCSETSFDNQNFCASQQSNHHKASTRFNQATTTNVNATNATLSSAILLADRDLIDGISALCLADLDFGGKSGPEISSISDHRFRNQPQQQPQQQQQHRPNRSGQPKIISKSKLYSNIISSNNNTNINNNNNNDAKNLAAPARMYVEMIERKYHHHHHHHHHHHQNQCNNNNNNNNNISSTTTNATTKIGSTISESSTIFTSSSSSSFFSSSASSITTTTTTTTTTTNIASSLSFADISSISLDIPPPSFESPSSSRSSSSSASSSSSSASSPSSSSSTSSTSPSLSSSSLSIESSNNNNNNNNNNSCPKVESRNRKSSSNGKKKNKKQIMQQQQQQQQQQKVKDTKAKSKRSKIEQPQQPKQQKKIVKKRLEHNSIGGNSTAGTAGIERNFYHPTIATTMTQLMTNIMAESKRNFLPSTAQKQPKTEQKTTESRQQQQQQGGGGGGNKGGQKKRREIKFESNLEKTITTVDESSFRAMADPTRGPNINSLMDELWRNFPATTTPTTTTTTTTSLSSSSVVAVGVAEKMAGGKIPTTMENETIMPSLLRTESFDTESIKSGNSKRSLPENHIYEAIQYDQFDAANIHICHAHSFAAAHCDGDAGGGDRIEIMPRFAPQQMPPKQQTPPAPLLGLSKMKSKMNKMSKTKKNRSKSNFEIFHN